MEDKTWQETVIKFTEDEALYLDDSERERLLVDRKRQAEISFKAGQKSVLTNAKIVAEMEYQRGKQEGRRAGKQPKAIECRNDYCPKCGGKIWKPKRDTSR